MEKRKKQATKVIDAINKVYNETEGRNLSFEEANSVLCKLDLWCGDHHTDWILGLDCIS